MGDSGAGVITNDFLVHNFPNWQASREGPTWIPELDSSNTDWNRLQVSDLYKAIGSYYPETKLAQFNTINDSIQTFFYEIMIVF